MKNMRSLAVAVIIAGLVSPALGVISRFTDSDIAGFSPARVRSGHGYLLLAVDKSAAFG